MTLTSNYQTCNKNAFWTHIFRIFPWHEWQTLNKAFSLQTELFDKLKIKTVNNNDSVHSIPAGIFPLISLSLLIVKPVPSVSSQLTQNSPGRHAHWAEPIKDVHIWRELALLAVSQKVSITIFTNCESRFIIMYFLQYSDF